jgi:hypothetical protein
MKPVAKVMASETLARMLAVAAMLVIAGSFSIRIKCSRPNTSALNLSLQWRRCLSGGTT